MLLGSPMGFFYMCNTHALSCEAACLFLIEGVEQRRVHGSHVCLRSQTPQRTPTEGLVQRDADACLPRAHTHDEQASHQARAVAERRHDVIKCFLLMILESQRK